MRLSVSLKRTRLLMEKRDCGMTSIWFLLAENAFRLVRFPMDRGSSVSLFSERLSSSRHLSSQISSGTFVSSFLDTKKENILFKMP